jgi:2,5-furandicarboxylate decarboxylase 1
MAKDMRSWIDQLEEAGELERISDAIDLESEMGSVLSVSKEKALLFENIKDHPGQRVLGQAPANMRHVGIAFGTEKESVTKKFASAIDAGLIKCQMIDSGPVKDLVLTGSDVRLKNLPIHLVGEKDKAPFITSGLCITKDPESGVRNLAFHRLQLKLDNQTGIMMQPERHSALIYKKYEAMNEPMPIAVMIGHHPAYYFSAAYTGPFRLDELEVAGALLGEPVQLVKCETVPLEVPAHAEIILEGHVPPNYREDEGPFAEFQNYYAAERKNPVFNVTAITMRKDAIYKTLQPQPEGIFYSSVPMAAALFRDLKNTAGYVDLKDVYCNWGTLFGVVVKMTPRFYGEAKHVLLAALSSVYLHQKIAIAVDEDVDIYDPQDVAWAITTRVDPATDVTIVPGVRGHPLDLSAPELKRPGVNVWQRLGSRMLIDATKPPTCDPEQRGLFDRTRPPTRHQGQMDSPGKR